MGYYFPFFPVFSGYVHFCPIWVCFGQFCPFLSILSTFVQKRPKLPFSSFFFPFWHVVLHSMRPFLVNFNICPTHISSEISLCICKIYFHMPLSKPINPYLTPYILHTSSNDTPMILAPYSVDGITAFPPHSD